MASRQSRTLPSAFRRGQSGVASANEADGAAANAGRGSPLFSGLHLNLGLSNLISGGINFLGNQLRRNRTPTSTPTPSTSSAAASSASSSSTSGGGGGKARMSALRAGSTSSAGSDNFYETYELHTFPSLPEAATDDDDAAGVGAGHEFRPAGTFNPTWCDLCGDLIWGLYDTGACRCRHCQFTCHVKCQTRVRLNCSILLGIGGDDDDAGEEESLKTARDKLDDDEDEEDEVDTLANISTLKSDEVFYSQDDDTAVNEEDDGEEAFKTLKDVQHFHLDHDDDDLAAAAASAASERDKVTSQSSHQQPLNSLFPLERLFGDALGDVTRQYNAASPVGQETALEKDENGSVLCRGFIRVQMHLSRPINVLSGTRPPSIYNVTNQDVTLVDDENTKLTSFYLPPKTVKALHVTSETTTQDVIRALLAKFRVADNPHKYALYEKNTAVASTGDEGGGGASAGGGGRRKSSTLSRVRMRKLKNEECPLVLALLWCQRNVMPEKTFVLQENDPGEILWESFTLPELKNFLLILDREEAWYKKRIHEKYDFVGRHIQELINEKRAAESSAEKDGRANAEGNQ